MKMMKINEIFYSLQGEGHNTGRAAVFVRFAGCNLRCPFCDTDFNSGVAMSEEAVVKSVKSYGCSFVVLTGGEPMLQVTKSFIDSLHAIGCIVAMESNGTINGCYELGIDWLTISPKSEFVGQKGMLNNSRANELKVVYDGRHAVQDYGVQADEYYLQPCDTGDAGENLKIQQSCINFILHNPQWKLSLQTQKIIHVK